MKHKTRLLSLLLVILLAIALFSGCRNKDENPSDTVSPPSPTTATQSQEPTEELTTGEFKLPIVEEPITLTAWRAFTSSVVTSPNDIAANKELERLTNIKIDYMLSPTIDAAQNFGLLMTSQELPDLLFMQDNTSSTLYRGGHDKAIDDGVFLRLNDLIEKWAPNYKAMLDSNDTIYRQAVTDQGNMAVFVTIQDGNEPAWCGPLIRQDYLDKVGKNMPQTYDDLYDVLKAFKNELNVEQPLSIGYLGYNTLTHTMTAGFDVDPTFYNENGTVKFGFIEEGFRDYLTLMNRWYSEGLIDQDFYTRNADVFGNNENIINGKIGAWEHGIASRITVYKASAEDPDFRVVGMPFPRKNASDVAHFRRFNEIVGTTNTALTANLLDDATRLEAAVRWMDFRYTEQGYTILNYGIEGESFEYVDGKPQFTELIYNNPEDSFPNMREKYADQGYGYYIWKRQYIAYNQDQLDAFDTWGESASGDWVMPPVTLTSQEGEEFSAIYGDIETYVNETVVKFITGDKPISEFEEFASRIRSLGIDRCIEIYQAALDRYNSR